ncbi:MAG: hypothetical protein ACREYB_06240 [Casimicrobiaceae bacterium]
MRTLICLALSALLSGCIPIGVRGTSIGDGGAATPASPVASAPFARPHPA